MEQKSVLSGFCIVVADRGWSIVGHAEHDGEWCVMPDARVIRRWGTTKGLAELAQKGPLENTKLEDRCPVRIPAKAILMMMDCEESKWKE